MMNLGSAQNMTSDSGSRSVRLIILERLPATLLLLGTAEFITFFASIFLALSLSRFYGSFWDKLVIALSPTSAAPGWFYGIFHILIFASNLLGSDLHECFFLQRKTFHARKEDCPGTVNASS